MTREEIIKLLIQIKVFFSRFDGVEKTASGYAVNPAVADSWHRRIGFMEYQKALVILDSYMASENGSRTPTISLWMNAGRIATKAGRCTATLDRKHSCIMWQPEEGGRVYEKPVKWNARREVWEDEDGYEYIIPE